MAEALVIKLFRRNEAMWDMLGREESIVSA